MKKLFSKVKATKGFTLVEMIVVMAIIGILVALLAPNVATLIKDAQDTSNDAKAKNVMTTLAAYNTKMLKDGYSFKGALNLKIDGAAKENGHIMIVDTSATGNINTKVMALWQKDSKPNTVPFAGKATGYLPANVISGDEKMFVYMTKEGNVLGVVYVDGSYYVKAANSSLTLGDLDSSSTRKDQPLTSATIRDNLGEATGLKFTE